MYPLVVKESTACQSKQEDRPDCDDGQVKVTGCECYKVQFLAAGFSYSNME